MQKKDDLSARCDRLFSDFKDLRKRFEKLRKEISENRRKIAQVKVKR